MESLATAAFWVFTLPAVVALVCLTLNALRSRRRIADLETTAGAAPSVAAGAGAGAASVQLGLVCTASDPSSVGASVKSPGPQALVLEVEPGAQLEKVETASPREPQASSQASPTSLETSRRRVSLRRMSSLFGSWEGTNGAVERDRAGHERSRPSSAAITVTVEEVVVTDHDEGEDDEDGGEVQRGGDRVEP